MDSSIIQEVSFGQGIFLRHTRFPIKGVWFEKKEMWHNLEAKRSKISPQGRSDMR